MPTQANRPVAKREVAFNSAARNICLEFHFEGKGRSLTSLSDHFYFRHSEPVGGVQNITRKPAIRILAVAADMTLKDRSTFPLG